MRWISAVSGLAVWIAAMVALAAVNGGSAPAPSPEAITPEIVAEVVEVTRSSVGAEVGPPTIELDELGSSVSDVLASRGYTQFVRAEELDLPPSIVALLQERDAVLVVPAPGGPDDE